ncbi:Fe-S cluster assembly protein SufD, partial [bacterium]|nr:Fe-S cluster assembly protein SufD [bacterium]
PAGAAAAARIVLRAGTAPVVNVSPEAAAAGLAVTPIVSSADLAAHAGDEEGAAFELFRGLNEALWNCGVRIIAPRGAVLGAPIHVRVQAGAGAVLPRIVVEVGEGAEVTLVEEHTGGRLGTRVVGRTELVAAAAARLHHVLVQRWEDGINGHLTARARVGREADLLTTFASLGGDRAKVELLTDLAGEGARSEMMGIAFGTGNQRFDHHTRHRHLACNTWSNIDFKAVADGSSRSSYTGLIRIEEKARASEAYQENRNLLLSSAGRADSIPELEILNEDVSCSHGATVAPVDPAQVFYLQSRGLAPGEAVRLVVQGFLAKAIDRLPDGTREAVAGLVDSRLEGLRGRAA